MNLLSNGVAAMAGPPGGSGARKRPSSGQSLERDLAAMMTPVDAVLMPAPPTTAVPLPPPLPREPMPRVEAPPPSSRGSRRPAGTPPTPAGTRSYTGYDGAEEWLPMALLRSTPSMGVKDDRWSRVHHSSFASPVPRAQFGNVARGATFAACTTTPIPRALPRRRQPRWWPAPVGLALLGAAPTPRVALLLPPPFGLLFPRGLPTVSLCCRLDSRGRCSPAGACAASSPLSARRIARGAIRRSAWVCSPQWPWNQRL